MRKWMKNEWKRIVAALLVITMMAGSAAMETLAAGMQNDSVQTEEMQTKQSEKKPSDAYVIDKADMIASENTENSTTYDAGDGVLVTEFYGQQVRFRTDEGELVDYDPSLVEIQESESIQGISLDAYKYENKEGDKKQYFPEVLSEETPILMENQDYQIQIAPVEVMETLTEEASITRINTTQEAEAAVVPAELQTGKIRDIYEEEKVLPIKTVYPMADGRISYEYTSLENGIKEEIVLSGKPENNTFSFILTLPGLTIRKNKVSKGLTIYDADNKIVAGIQEPCINDASGDAYSEALDYELEVIEEKEGKYGLTLTVDEAYLNDENRQYPVTIDPTLTWNDNSRISDVYVLSNYPGYNYYEAGITSFYLGKGSQGASRACLAIGDLSSIYKKYIKKATLTLYECTNSQAGKNIQAYRITGDWDPGTVTWNTQPPWDKTLMASFSSRGPGNTDIMDLTSLVRAYADRRFVNYGLLLKNANESTNLDFTKFFGVRHATYGYRPKLTVEYYARPSAAASMTLTPEYIRPGQNTKVAWTGITAGDLSYIQYRIAEYEEKTNKEIRTETAYSEATKIGTTANGEGTVTAGGSVPSGSYKTYKAAIRGVGTSGALGEETSRILKVDNAPPTGSIKVLAAGTAEETEVLQDTVEIIGEVDGTGSPIRTSSMKLYDSTGTFIQDIYTNSTLSKIQTVFTPELPNGTYTLKLQMEDTVGFTAEQEKQIRILNKLSAPEVKGGLSNQGNVEIAWNFPYASTEVCGIAYKLPGSEEWRKAENAKGVRGTFTVCLPDAEGSYPVAVCGIDEAGGHGAEAVAKCVIDKTPPQAQISSADRGLVYGTIADVNLSEWSVGLKKKGSSQEESLFQGKRSVDAGYIGFFDMGKMEAGIPYEVVLRVSDLAGNESSTSCSVIRREDESIAQRESPDFAIKRPAYTAHSANHIIFPANISSMELTEWPLAGPVPEGETRWYCDGKKVSGNVTWNGAFPAPSSGCHSILAVIAKDGNIYYSQSRIKNREMIPVKSGETISLPKGSISVRVNTGAASESAKVLIDGKKAVNVPSGETICFAKLSSGESATAAAVSVTPIQDSADTDKWILEVDCIEEETFELSEAENYHPYEASIKDKLNYKTYLKWDGVKGEWPQQISYEVYRGLEAGFLPSEENRIASDIRANYWAEMNVNYSRTFYYRIRAVEKDESGAIIRASSYSNEIDSTVVDADEYVKRMGRKEYWEYVEFDTPSGNGGIEKSRGNMVYTQADAEIPNEQLPVCLERTYNSQSSEKTAFGVGWTHSFDMELLNVCKNDSLDFRNIVLKDGNGTLFFYNKKEDGTYVSSMGKYTELKKEDKTEEVLLPDKTIGVKDKTKTVTVKSAFTMTTKDNVEYRFNSGGQMVYMSEANGNFLLFEYEQDKGLLSKVTTSKNLSMEFIYFTEADLADAKKVPDLLTVKEVRLPDGSRVSYQYADDRLSGIQKIGTDKASTLTWSMEYNDAKQLTGISDACGNRYQVAYEKEKADKITYPNGESIALVYDEKNNQTSTYKEVTENGKPVQIYLEMNTFEPSSGNSIQMTDSEGNQVTYEYLDNLRTKSIYSMTYQEIEGRYVVEKTTEKTETTKYSAKENVTEEVDEYGITTTYTYNENAPKALASLLVGRQEVNAEGDLITDETYTYDGFGNVIKVYDAVDDSVVETTYYEEDDPVTGKLKGEIKSEKEYFLKDSANQTTTETTYSYDASGKKTEVMTEKSGQYTVKTTTVYDVMGRQISSTDTMGLTTTTEYDPFGRVSKVTVKQGEVTDVVTRSYDDNGALVKEVEEDGTVYTYAYDSMNRVVAEGIQKDGLSKTWTTEYTYGTVDLHTGAKKTTVPHVMITTEKNPDGEILEQTCVDTKGNTIRSKQGGIYADFTYDREGHVTLRSILGTSTDNDTPVMTAYLYDKSGNLSGQIANPGYDAGDGYVTVNNDSIVQTLSYDSEGNVVSATDGMGQMTSYTYDAKGRITKATIPAYSGGSESTTTYKYDQLNGNGTTTNTITDALGRTSSMVYNSTMQLTEVTDLGDGSVDPVRSGFTYNSKGQAEKQTDSRGSYKTYEYDGKGRVTAVHYYNANKQETLRTAYTYDKADNVTSMRDYKVASGNAMMYRYTGYSYDRLKRLSAQTEINTSTDPTTEEKEQHTIQYEYDIDGNLTMVTYPFSAGWKIRKLKYTYDQKKWLQKVIVADAGGKEATLRDYTYDKYGKVDFIRDYRVIREDGSLVTTADYTTCKYTYDAVQRPVTMTYTDSTNPSVVMEEYTCTYDKNNRITKETFLNEYPEAVSDRQDETRTYEYDDRGNLTAVVIMDADGGTRTENYTYDAVGNRLKLDATDNGTDESTAYIYNSLNQLTSSKTTTGGTVTEQTTYGYDASGNQIREEDIVSGTLTENTYDSAGQLSGCKKTENGTVTLTQTNLYNGSGSRIQKTENNDITNYFYGSGGLLYTENGSGTRTSLNLHGIAGNVIATGRYTGGKESYYYYHKDLGGSTTSLRDASGTAVVSYRYSDFGKTEIYGNTAFYNEICYNGAIYDKSTGHYYLNARYYDPESGRFLSQDSYRGDASRPATMNLYNYCANDPVNYDDPSGHIAISRIVGGIIGGAVGYLAGRKIAKATKAKGRKKVAIIAGCTVGGAAIGALVGPKVAKVVKKAATVVKRKVASSQRLSKISNAYKKAKSGIKKTVSKAQKAVAKGKTKPSNTKNQIRHLTQKSSKKPVDIQLKYKEGWSAAQKAEADAKVKALSEAFTKKTEVKRAATSAGRRYRSVFGKNSVPKGYDVDHIIDLQLGGLDDISNMVPLDRSVNRSLGAQIMHAIKDYNIGTIFGMFTIS